MFVFNHIRRNRVCVSSMGGVLLVLFFFACKREVVDPIEGFTDPVFFVDYRVGNVQDTLHVIAGVEKVYHFTAFEPGDYIVCTGAFAKADCPEANCPGSLKFKFRNNTTGNIVDKTIFETGNHPYTDAGSPEGGIAIQWIDQDNHLWRSDWGPQETLAYFRIVNSDAYFSNEKGQATQKMEIAFSCRLFRDGGGQEISFDGTGVVAVAYP